MLLLAITSSLSSLKAARGTVPQRGVPAESATYCISSRITLTGALP